MTNEYPDGDDFVGDEATDDVATWDADGSLDDVGDDAALAEQAEAAARAEFGDLDAELSDMERAAGSAQLPTLAIIGRPNVGK